MYDLVRKRCVAQLQIAGAYYVVRPPILTLHRSVAPRSHTLNAAVGTGWGLYAAALGVMLLAWSVRSDKDAAWCAPTSALQGHAAWHAGAAIAVFLLYLFLRGERDADASPSLPTTAEADSAAGEEVGRGGRAEEQDGGGGRSASARYELVPTQPERRALQLAATSSSTTLSQV